MRLPENEILEFGKVVGLHGLRGDLKVLPHTLAADSLAHAQLIYLRDRDDAIAPYVPTRTSLHKGSVLLSLEGVDSVPLAEVLIGQSVLMDLNDLPELPGGEYYWHELQGLAVFDRTRGDIGILRRMFTTSAHDIYEVDGRFGEVLIPVVDRFIVKIDLDEKRIQVDLPEGLIPEPDEN
jgi:16S rRNA processing protein RimM